MPYCGWILGYSQQRSISEKASIMELLLKRSFDSVDSEDKFNVFLSKIRPMAVSKQLNHLFKNTHSFNKYFFRILKQLSSILDAGRTSAQRPLTLMKFVMWLYETNDE